MLLLVLSESQSLEETNAMTLFPTALPGTLTELVRLVQEPFFLKIMPVLLVMIFQTTAMDVLPVLLLFAQLVQQQLI